MDSECEEKTNLDSNLAQNRVLFNIYVKMVWFVANSEHLISATVAWNDESGLGYQHSKRGYL